MVENGDITGLLSDARKGDQRAIERLVPLVYQELRRLAQHYMQGERPPTRRKPRRFSAATETSGHLGDPFSARRTFLVLQGRGLLTGC